MANTANHLMREPVRVLVVQNDADHAWETALVLEAAGFAVCGIVAAGAGALNAVSLLEPDVLLVDISTVSGLGGAETAHALRARSGRARIIFLTGGGDRETTARVRALRPDAHLLQPVRRQDLEAAVVRALETGTDP